MQIQRIIEIEECQIPKLLDIKVKIISSRVNRMNFILTRGKSIRRDTKES